MTRDKLSREEGLESTVIHLDPARGVPFRLQGTFQVVASLGYFQFKAKPGVFQFYIRGRKIFKLDSAGNEGWDSTMVELASSEITVTSFEGLTLYPSFSRLPGMETADVLEEEESEERISDRFVLTLSSLSPPLMVLLTTGLRQSSSLRSQLKSQLG